jgi:hypothetical protein
MLLFETLGLQHLGGLQGSECIVALLKIPFQLLGISQEIADLTPDRCFEELSLDLPTAANALPSEAIAVCAGAAIVLIVLQCVSRTSFASRLAVIGVTTDCAAGKSL